MQLRNSSRYSKRDISPKEIVNWVQSNFEVKRINKKGWMKVCNPFQERETGVRDTKFHFNIHPKHAVVKDWRPHFNNHDGSFVQFVSDYLRCTIPEAIAAVKSAKQFDINDLLLEDEVEEDDPQLIYQMELPNPTWELTEGPEKLHKVALRYLASRCVSLEEAKAWKIMYGVGTIVFPYIEYDEIVYWQSREIADKRFLFPDETKYGVSKTHYFWGWHRAEPGEDLFIVESLFGVPSIGEGALASGGADLGERQAAKLDVLSPSRIILCPDNDDPGIASLIYNFKLLTAYKDILYYCVPPKIKDHNGNFIKDWNELDQLCVFHSDLAVSQLGEDARMGHKYSRHYIENNMVKLNQGVVIRLRKQLSKDYDPQLRKILEN